MSTIYGENGKVDESLLTKKRIKTINSTNRAIVLDTYRKILKHNRSPLIQKRYKYLLNER